MFCDAEQQGRRQHSPARELLAKPRHGEDVIAAMQHKHRNVRPHYGGCLSISHSVRPDRVQLALPQAQTPLQTTASMFSA